MELTLTPEVEALLQEQMQSGRFQDPNEVIAIALHVLSDSAPLLVGLDALIQEGLDDIDRGDVFTEEEARAHIAAVRAKL